MKIKEINIRQPWKDLGIWSIVFICMFLTDIRHDLEFAIFRSLFMLASILVVYYLNKSVFLPRLFFKNKTHRYLMMSLVTLFANVALFTFLESVFLFPLLEAQGITTKFFFPVMGHLVFDILGMYISTFISVSNINRQEKESRQVLLAEKTAIELKFLKSQINPHFLFNALNNIYTLSYIGSEKAPDVILQLSDMLRYQIYDCESEKIEIRKEIDYLRNYIEFQQLKTEDRQNIDFQFHVEDEYTKVAPFLFIPFIENAFKHSHLEEYGGEVKGLLSLKNGIVHFNLENSLPSLQVVRNGQNSGIGLENVQKRLELIYPGKYTLEMSSDTNKYSVSLMINVG